MMQLDESANHLLTDIREFQSETSTSTQIVVLTGNNGSGKSHLLGQLAHTWAQTEGTLMGETLAPFGSILAVATTVTDPFPFRRNLQHYQYLGQRSASNGVFIGNAERTTSQAFIEAQLENRTANSSHIILDALNLAGLRLYIDSSKYLRQSKTYSHIQAPTSKALNNSGLIHPRESTDEHLAHALSKWSQYLTTILPHSMKSHPPIGSQFELPHEDFMDLLAAIRHFTRDSPITVDLLFWQAHRMGISFECMAGSRRDPRPRKLSAGQHLLFSQMLRIAISLSDDTLILIDEPENCLHLDLQAEYLTLLRTLCTQFRGICVIAATHSPFIVGDADAVYKLDNSRLSKLHLDYSMMSLEEVVHQCFGSRTSATQTMENDLRSILDWLGDHSRGAPPPEVTTAARRLQAKENSETPMLTELLTAYQELL